MKSSFAKFVTGSKDKPTLISELQAEPWPNNGQQIRTTPISEQMKLFPVKQLNKNLEYAKETRLGPILFWGAEWWYYMKLQGISNYWTTAKIIFED